MTDRKKKVCSKTFNLIAIVCNLLGAIGKNRQVF